MGIRNHRSEELRRLHEKSLDAQFRTCVQQGLNCSAFESEAVLEVVKEVYFPLMSTEAVDPRPGILTLVALAADEPAGKPIAQCAKRTIRVTLHRGDVDDRVLQTQGPTAFRRGRIPDILQEAVDQDALLTREDLAYRIFGVALRTISYDLAALRQQTPAPDLPLRGTIHDIGPVLTHRVRIVTQALAGQSTREICRHTQHSPDAVANYLALFTRVLHLRTLGVLVPEMAFVLHRGAPLIQRYIELITTLEATPTGRQQLVAWQTSTPGPVGEKRGLS